MSTLPKDDGLTGGRPKRKVKQPKSYKEPSIKTKLRNNGSSPDRTVAATKPARTSKQSAERFAINVTSICNGMKCACAFLSRYAPSFSKNSTYLSSSASQVSWKCNGTDCSAYRSFKSKKCTKFGIKSYYGVGAGALCLKERAESVYLPAANGTGTGFELGDNEVVGHLLMGEEDASESHDGKNHSEELADWDTEVQFLPNGIGGDEINELFNEVADDVSIGEEGGVPQSPNSNPPSPTNLIASIDTTRQHHDEHSDKSINNKELAYMKGQLSNLQRRYDVLLQENEDLKQKLANAQEDVASLVTQNDELETPLHNESISFGLEHMKLERRLQALKPNRTSASSSKIKEPKTGRPAQCVHLHLHWMLFSGLLRG